MRWRWSLLLLLLLLAAGLGWWMLGPRDSTTIEATGGESSGAQTGIGAPRPPSGSLRFPAGTALSEKVEDPEEADVEDGPQNAASGPGLTDGNQPAGLPSSSAEGSQNGSAAKPASEGAATPEEAEDEPLAVDGKVVDGSGAPVAGATVSVLVAGGRTLGSQTSDAAGRFSFETMEEGQVSFEASKDGLRGQAGPFMLGGQGLRPVVIVLGANGVLAGKVLLRSDRSPVAGARLVVVDESRNLEMPAISGPDGSFRAEVASPGEFMVTLKDNRELVDTDLRVRVSLAEGETRDDLLLLVRRGLQLEGTVTREGKPVEGATVVLEDLSAYFNVKTWETLSDAAGNFSFQGARPGGRFVAKAMHPERGFGESAVVATHPGGPAGRLDVKLTPGRTVEGRLVTDDGRGVPGHKVNLGRMDVRLPMPGTMTQSGPDGSFQVRSVPPGEYQFVVETAKDARLLSPSFPVDDAGPTEPIVINLGPGPEGYISGRVTDEAGKPLPGAGVEARAPNPVLVSWTVTDLEGRYRIGGLGPGSHFLVSASAAGYSEGFVDGMQPSAVDVDLVLGPAALLRGRVLDEATGAPLTEFHIFGRQLDMDVASPDGSFAVTLDERHTVLHFSAPGYLSQETDRLESGSGLPLEGLVVRMRKGFPVGGLVRDQPSGAPIPGARVQLLTQGQLAVNMLLWDVKWNPEDPFTDAQGRFEVAGPPPGLPYSMVAYHPDFAPGLVNGTTDRQVELALNRGGAVTVTVRQDGVLLDSSASFFGYFQPDDGPVEFSIAYTLFKGQWRFEKVPVGTYSMKAHGFDGTKSEAAVVFEVREGDDLALELLLPPKTQPNDDTSDEP